MATIQESNTKYPFVQAHLSREPFIFEVLDEIARYQKEVLKNGSGSLATLDILKDSRNIKMPFTHVRGKSIAYILDSLSSMNPDDLKKIFSFKFIVEPESKKLSINEEVEYTVLCSHADYIKLQEERDQKSIESLDELLERFRLFNLTKLVKKARNKGHLSKIIKYELGKSVFTFKHFSLDKNSLEVAEDYCFHRSNYETVMKSVQTDLVKKILNDYSTQVSRRLQKFGILNSEFSDFRESKVDYLMSILLEDLATSLAPKDIIEVKNFNSLRNCLIKVEKIIDPLVTIGNDLLRHIRESGITRKRDILSIFNNLTEDMFDAWIKEAPFKHRVLVHSDDIDTYCIDGTKYHQKLAELHRRIFTNIDDFTRLDHYEKQALMDSFEMLCDTGRNLLSSQNLTNLVLQPAETAEKVKKIIHDFDDYRKRLAMQENIEKVKDTQREKKSLLRAVVDFFKSIFSGSRKRDIKKTSESAVTPAIRHIILKDSRNILEKITSNNAKLIPLSNYIELSEENHLIIDSIIDELRNSNIKTVIPIYGARKVLYPQRSRKYLIADTEYLLIDPSIMQNPDLIRSFTDSMAGEKIKEETVPPSGIIAVEKYLLTLYRQKRAQMKRKDMIKKE